MRKVPDWDSYFMNIARAVSLRSKDPNTQVGAVLVDCENRIIGTGYNGFPPLFTETPELWQAPTKYDLVIHAEANCLLHSVGDLKAAWLFTTMFPCKECCKLIAGAGIDRVVYSDDKYKNQISEDILFGCHIDIDRVK